MNDLLILVITLFYIMFISALLDESNDVKRTIADVPRGDLEFYNFEDSIVFGRFGTFVLHLLKLAGWVFLFYKLYQIFS